MKRLSLAALAVGVAVLLWASVANAASVLFPVGGGTGTSTAPGYGKVLVGNKSGLFDYVATSTIGSIAPYFTATSATATSTFAGPLQAPLIDKGGQVYNVKAFGAKGDGKNDDTAAIQAAIDALPASGGQVYFPAGVYPLDTSLVIKKHGVTLQGAALASTFADQVNQQPGIRGVSLLLASTTLGFPNSTPVIKVGELGTSKMWTGGGVYDLTITGTRTYGTPGDGVQIYNVQAFRVMNDNINNVGIGIRVASDQGGGISNVDIERNIINDTTDIGIYMGDHSEENYVRFNYISGSTGYGVYTEGRGNTFLGNHIESILLKGSGTADGAAIYNGGVRTFIYENDILSSHTWGIYSNNDHFLIESNYINNSNDSGIANGSGIWIAGSPTDGSVIGNTIHDNDAHMVYGIYNTTDVPGGLYVNGNFITGATGGPVYSTNNSLADVAFPSRVGIGTSSPYSLLSVAGQVVAQNFNATSTTSTSYLMGPTGIGTNAPVSSGLNVSASGKAALRLDGSQNDNFLTAYTSGSQRFGINYTSIGQLELQSFSGTTMIINDQGNNLSIGTTNNGSPLTINGGTSIGSSFSTSAAPSSGLIVAGLTGIGTSSPAVHLDVFSTASTTLRVDSNASSKGGQLLIKDSDGSGYTCVTANNGVLTAKIAASATSC